MIAKRILAVKRVYDPPEPGDGTRILVDRLWPRGIAKHKAGIDLWLREWDAFCAAYEAELHGEAAQAAAKDLRDRLRKGPVTLLYAARDEHRNNAVALKAWLDRNKGQAS